MLKTTGLAESVGQSAAVSLVDWYIFEDELILVMERPALCKDLYKYLKAHRGPLEEREAKVLLVEDFFSVYVLFHLVQITIEMSHLSLYHLVMNPTAQLV